MRDRRIKIVFRRSTSKSLKEAIDIAILIGADISDNKIVIDISLYDTIRLWEHINKLLNIIDKWKSFEFYYQDILYNEHYRYMFYTIQDIRNCYIGALDYSENFEMCKDNYWGCSKLNYLKKVKCWLDYGYQQDSIWIIDKEAISKELKIEAFRKKLECCPAFDINRALTSVNKLPDSIFLNKNWKIVDIIEAGKKKQVLRAQEKLEGEECPYPKHSDEWCDWMIDHYLLKYPII